MKKLFSFIVMLILSIGVMWAEDLTVTLDKDVSGFSSISAKNGNTSTITIDEIKYIFNSTSDKTVNIDNSKSGGPAIKFQDNTSFTISSEGTIKNITFTQIESTRTFTASVGSLSTGETSTWTGSANSVTFTNGSSNAYITSITVTYEPAPDTTAPSLTSTIPADGATEQADRVLILKFNEAVKVADASKISITPNTGVTLGTPTVDTTDPKKVNIQCTGLSKATKYTVNVASGAITDEAGNAFAGTAFSFVTAFTAPSFSPNGGSITANTNVTISADDGTTILYKWGSSALTADEVKEGSTYSGSVTATIDGVAAAPYLTAIAKKTIDGTDYYSAATTSNAFADGTSTGVTKKDYPYSWIYDNSESGVNWGNTSTQVAQSGSGWTKHSDNYYGRTPSSTGEGFAGTDAVEGLKFTGGFVGLDWGLGHMYVGAGTKITIPSLTTEYKVTIKAGVGDNGGTITASNADVDGAAYTPELTTERDEYVWYVTANGNVSFTFSGETWINYIKVEKIEKTDLTAFGRETTWQTVTTYSEGATINLQMAKVAPTVPTSLLHVTSSNESVLKVKSVTFGTSSGGRQRIYFNLDVLKTGTSDITISFDGNDRYNVATYSETFTVNKPSQDLSYATTQVTKYSGAAAFTNKLTKTFVKGDITYSSSDTNVATVASDGKVTVVGSGTATISATAAETTEYAATTASYLLVVVEAFNYSVASGEEIAPGNEIKTVDGIVMRYGGFTNEFGKGDRHTFYNGDTSKTVEDKFKKGGTDETGLDGTYYAIPNGQNPMFEYQDATTKHTNTRGWDRTIGTKDFLGNNVPVFGAFYVFEPAKDGNLTVSVLQTGSIQDLTETDRGNNEVYKILHEKEKYNGGIIDKWDYKALYLTDERGNTVKASAKKSYSNYSHPYVFESDNLTNTQRDVVSLRPHIVGEGFEGEATDKYVYQFTYGATVDNEGNTIAGESDCVKIKKEMAKAFGLTEGTELTDEIYEQYLKTDRLVDIMENERNGYWTLTKSHSVYTFPVKAGKTYFLFTDGSKLGLNGFSFAANSNSSTLTIEGADNASSATTMGAKDNCTVTLKRKIIKDQPNTLMLPFSMNIKKVEEVFGEGTQVLHVESIDDCIHFVRHHYPMIVAGEPCIIYPTFKNLTTSTDDKGREYIETHTITNVTVEAESVLNRYTPVTGNGFTFTGCFKKEDMNIGSYWLSATADGKTGEDQTIYLHQTDVADYMTNTRAFFQNDSGNANAKLTNGIFADAIDEGSNSTVTGISIVEDKAERISTKNGVYSINGQKLDGSNLPKGIYIIDGKKVVIK